MFRLLAEINILLLTSYYLVGRHSFLRTQLLELIATVL